MAYLIVKQGVNPGYCYKLKSRVVRLGKAPTNDIIIEDPYVSREHASLTIFNEYATLQDLGSKNGTLVNGIPVTQHNLVVEDEIILGRTILIFYSSEMPESALLKSEEYKRLDFDSKSRKVGTETVIYREGDSKNKKNNNYKDAVSTSDEMIEQRKSRYSIIAQCKKMQELLAQAMTVAETDSNVLLRGESGTGKELFAQAIHYNSARRKRQMICVNCAALTETLLESILFGHEKGAFTGAFQTRLGKFELAHGGTIFLDEIGDMSLFTQAKILRVLQEGEFERVGGDKTIKVNVRVIAATNKNLEQAIRDNEFREDLYYRLRVVEITLPPLRERQGDIPLLAEFFLKMLSQQIRTHITSISPDAMKCFQQYKWPGNIRELKNAIERALVLVKSDTMLPEHLPFEIRFGSCDENLSENATNANLTLADVEKLHILNVLQTMNGNKVEAAKILGITRSTLYEKLKAYGIGA